MSKVASHADKLQLEPKGKESTPRMHHDKEEKGASSLSPAPNTGETSRSSAKRKRPSNHTSPFRIKVGCVVALRFRPEGNSLSLIPSSSKEPPQQLELDENFVQAWTTPLPGRDSGLALIGKRVRCSFPKIQGQEQKRRVLEGEIVGLVDYGLKKRRGKPIRVELLIDKKHLEHFSYLQRTDEDVDISKLSEKERRNHRLVESIRGKNKATVYVKLCHPATMDTANSVRWVIQKRVPNKLFHKPSQRRNSLTSTPVNGKSFSEEGATGEGVSQNNDNGNKTNGAAAETTNEAQVDGDSVPNKGTSEPSKKRRRVSPSVEAKHVGDGNDSQEQQVGNWRWLAGRYHDKLLSCHHDTVDPYGAPVLSSGLVGEVLKVESSTSSDTLAVVTLRRLMLPEHTATGRQPHHGPFDIFDEPDAGKAENGSSFQIQVPVEHLIILSRKLQKTCDVGNQSSSPNEMSLEQLCLSHEYSLRNNVYLPLGSSGTPEPASAIDEQEEPPSTFVKCCHRCRKSLPESELITCTSKTCPVGPLTQWCETCLELLRSIGALDRNDDSALPCCHMLCDCQSCRSFAGSELQEELLASASDAADQVDAETDSKPSAFFSALSCISSMDPVDFDLPRDFLESGSALIPMRKPVSKVKARSLKTPKKQSASRSGRTTPKNGTRSTIGPKMNGKVDENGCELPPEEPAEDYSVFKPSCSRLLAYDPSRRKAKNMTGDFTNTDKPRNLRQAVIDSSGDGEKDEKTTSSRAARANQRRLLKGVAAIGAASLGLDTLASREPQLRFDRSGIHAWGVFADEDIASGEMIVEYRGELIGNAMAEKREKQYEAAKIGSDYMFRIDALNVCDATKQGNVARFINASCGPNCITKIITLDGSKRIVIYAKRDIRSGEELCYDYKFPLEYDESKRIPCHCGASECRGFMNWDKRYVTLPESPDNGDKRMPMQPSAVEDDDVS